MHPLSSLPNLWMDDAIRRARRRFDHTVSASHQAVVQWEVDHLEQLRALAAEQVEITLQSWLIGLRRQYELVRSHEDGHRMSEQLAAVAGWITAAAASIGVQCGQPQGQDLLPVPGGSQPPLGSESLDHHQPRFTHRRCR